MNAAEPVEIEVALPADRVWAALSEPARLWQTFSGTGRPAPVDGVMNGSVKTAAVDAPEWRYQMRMLDRDDDARTVHLDVFAQPTGHVGSARLTAGLEVHDRVEQTVLMLTWRSQANGHHQGDAEAWVAAVRSHVAEIVHGAVATLPHVGRSGPAAVLDTLQRLMRGRSGVVLAVVAATAAALALIAELVRLRRRTGGPR
ncbi:hypothetical protein [Pseudactinotalea sp.]|uniref:hypothetical protein n=1 Tax=Pseudactinotalea sp. TaxID=1926260 RepID=UPI003B3A9A71